MKYISSRQNDPGQKNNGVTSKLELDLLHIFPFLPLLALPPMSTAPVVLYCFAAL